MFARHFRFRPPLRLALFYLTDVLARGSLRAHQKAWLSFRNALLSGAWRPGAEWPASQKQVISYTYKLAESLLRTIISRQFNRVYSEIYHSPTMPFATSASMPKAGS
jgi:hypothetical protein